jgi:hypothetical protein
MSIAADQEGWVWQHTIMGGTAGISTEIPAPASNCTFGQPRQMRPGAVPSSNAREVISLRSQGKNRKLGLIGPWASAKGAISEAGRQMTRITRRRK